MSRKTIIDTKSGIDDAMAILFALLLIELKGHDAIPVARGAGRPMILPPHPASDDVHGKDGLGGVYLPEPRGLPVRTSAPMWIVEAIRAHPGEITLVAGPLTNLALAARMAIAFQVREGVLMGAAVAYVHAPDLFESERLPVHGETQGRCVGETVPDRRRRWDDLPGVNVCLGVDAPARLDLYRERMVEGDG
jgi:inosine-uridine nucleoside N-ribohydrolase